MDIKEFERKLEKVKRYTYAMQQNKAMIRVIENSGYNKSVYSEDEFYKLTDEQCKTVNHLIVSLLEQNNAEMEKELKPLADLLDAQK